PADRFAVADDGEALDAAVAGVVGQPDGAVGQLGSGHAVTLRGRRASAGTPSRQHGLAEPAVLRETGEDRELGRTHRDGPLVECVGLVETLLDPGELTVDVSL